MTSAHRGDDAARQQDSLFSARSALIAILRHRRRTLLLALLAGVLTLAALLVARRTYTSTASFTPQARRSMAGNFAGLASQFGFALPTGDATQSPQFYADLLQSREILGPLADTRFRTVIDGKLREANLIEILKVSGTTPALKRENAIKAILKRQAVSLNPKTGLVRVEMTLGADTLAHDVLERMLALLDAFNQQHRQTQVTAERVFTEGRLSTVRAEARVAEDNLQAFLQNNRTYENSPSLRFTFDRLSRDVSLRQQVLLTLSQAYEQARLEEVRNTPVLSIVERPSLPARPDSRGVPVKMLAAMLAVTLLCAIWDVMRELDARDHGVRTGERESSRCCSGHCGIPSRARIRWLRSKDGDGNGNRSAAGQHGDTASSIERD